MGQETARDPGQNVFLNYEYTHDKINNIIEKETEHGDYAYGYDDPFGRRLWKEVGGVRTVFHYTDEGLIGEYDSSGNEIKTYGYKPGSTWTTDPLFIKEGGEYYFYHNDHLGTPQKLTAVNGVVANPNALSRLMICRYLNPESRPMIRR